MSRAVIATLLVIIILVFGSISAAYFLFIQEKKATTSSVAKSMKPAPFKPSPKRPKHTIKKHPTTSPKTSKTLSIETHKSTWTSRELTHSGTTEYVETIKLSFPYIYEKPENWNGKCIIFVHGMGGDKSVWRGDMDEFKKYGYCVFAFDLPHHGERGRYRPSDFYDVVYRGSKEIILIEKFLRADGAKEVYLISKSLGSIVSGVALGSSRIEKAALLLASANLSYVLSRVKPRTEAERMALQELLNNPEKLREIDPLYHLPNYSGMVEFHCGKRDKLLPPESCIMAYEAASAAKSRKLIWHDLGHRMPLREYFDYVLEFFEEGEKAESRLLALVDIPETCGNGVCDVGEDWRSCPYDCIGKRLLVAFQLHIEELPGHPPYYNESRTVFMEYAETLDRLAKLFEKYGAKLSIQTEKQFADADVKFGRFILRELEARGHGIGVQSHLGHHIRELGLRTDEEKLRYNRAVKEVVAKALGHEPTNLGGGFELKDIGLLGVCDGCLGFISMTALEKPYYRQTGNSPTKLHPWILPRVQMISLKTGEWLNHDESGTIVYIPGWYKAKSFEIDCRKNPDCLAEAKRSLQEALKDMEPGMINTWYASSHLYQCGSGAEVDKVLKAYEEWLKELKPLMEKGEIVFLTFDEIAKIYLRWEKARMLAAG